MYAGSHAIIEVFSSDFMILNPEWSLGKCPQLQPQTLKLLDVPDAGQQFLADCSQKHGPPVLNDLPEKFHMPGLCVHSAAERQRPD